MGGPIVCTLSYTIKTDGGTAEGTSFTNGREREREREGERETERQTEKQREWERDQIRERNEPQQTATRGGEREGAGVCGSKCTRSSFSLHRDRGTTMAGDRGSIFTILLLNIQRFSSSSLPSAVPKVEWWSCFKVDESAGSWARGPGITQCLPPGAALLLSSLTVFYQDPSCLPSGLVFILDKHLFFILSPSAKVWNVCSHFGTEPNAMTQ